eukprot:COSAG01_NODE_24253_length_785_cov_1.113703_2_plen_118_part_01
MGPTMIRLVLRFRAGPPPSQVSDDWLLTETVAALGTRRLTAWPRVMTLPVRVARARVLRASASVRRSAHLILGRYPLLCHLRHQLLCSVARRCSRRPQPGLPHAWPSPLGETPPPQPL